ncbi:CD177 antigen [Erethizon dorsatum]
MHFLVRESEGDFCHHLDMIPAPLLAFLGVTFLLPGPQVTLVLTKGCTAEKDQEAKVTEHRVGPGLSITSYTRVCRLGDFCNDLSTTVPLWIPHPDTVPGTLRCPVCFSTDVCPENAPQQICPAGYTHCYDGVVRLRGGAIATNLRVQGCMPQPGCNLLNGTEMIGPIGVSEKCNSESGLEILDCHWGTLEAVRNVSELPLKWTTAETTCERGEGCQETLMLIKNGPQVTLVLTKGCTAEKDQEAKVTEHRAGPGLSIISYSRVCRQRDFCNDLSTTAHLGGSPSAKVPGTLRCPVCSSRDVCPENVPQQICPAGYTHCYNGVLKLRGGGIATNLRVQGCTRQPGCNLLNGTQVIGSMHVSENCNPKSGAQVDVVITKGCTDAEDQEPRVTWHRTGPGLSVVSYTRVCRHGDFCNNLSTTKAFWTTPPSTGARVPGTLLCPLCLSRDVCPENAPQQICPAGYTHCYNGVVRLRGGGIATNLRVQGCMPQPSCNLLNGTQVIGSMHVSENCNPKLDCSWTGLGDIKSSRDQSCGGGERVACKLLNRSFASVLLVGNGDVADDRSTYFKAYHEEMRQCSQREKLPSSTGHEKWTLHVLRQKQDSLICRRGSMLQMRKDLSQEPVEWQANGQEDCNPGEVCQETLLLIEPGQKSLLVGSKGCSSPERQDAPTTSIHSSFPGVLVASYARFCSSNLCNSASSSSVLLNSLPRPAAPALGDLQCPVCVQFSGSCSHDSNVITCPKTTHCYKGHIDTRGGGISATFSIQGCMPEGSRSLLNKAQKIGIFSVNEDFGEKKKMPLIPPSGAPAPYLAWAISACVPSDSILIGFSVANEMQDSPGSSNETIHYFSTNQWNLEYSVG